jgi:hypothetical protein
VDTNALSSLRFVLGSAVPTSVRYDGDIASTVFDPELASHDINNRKIPTYGKVLKKE